MIFEKWGRAFDLSKIKSVRKATDYGVEILLDDEWIFVGLKKYSSGGYVSKHESGLGQHEFYIDLISEWKRYKNENSQKVS